jgi:Ca-activated chloride channel homolog
MQVSYSLSSSVIPASSSSTIDLLISFKSEAASATPTRRPLNLSLVIDRSGSMAGAPLQYAIEAAQRLVEQLTPEDYLSVVIYDDHAETILPHAPVQDKPHIQALLRTIRAGGCTNLSGGWLMGCDYVQSQLSDDRLNRVLLLTDGQANMGITDSPILTNTARDKATQGIITTTLGFGNYFNEDLLIGMASAAGGNFYFIQSPDDASEVFGIELESLMSVAAQNLSITLQPTDGVTITQLLNSYRTQANGGVLQVNLGDVYTSEAKQMAVELAIAPQATLGDLSLLTANYSFQSIIDESIQSFHGVLAMEIAVGSAEAAAQAKPEQTVIEQISRFRIAKVKDEAIALADQGDFKTASAKLRSTLETLQNQSLQESFEVSEEMAQLEHYAQKLESRQFNPSIRKEMRDQAHQAQTRDRQELKLRGITAGSADSLERVSNAEGGGVVVQCIREGGKLRVRVVSEGYESDRNVQFPRSIRQEGVTYVVETIQLSADGSFYRASGVIRRLVRPGEEHLFSSGGSTRQPTAKRQKADAISLADLETTTSVGEGVLLQCLKDGKKLRIRVVSDGYSPVYNIRFPRSIREEGALYVVDEVEEVSSGGSYIAYGKIRRFVQQV